MTDQATFATRKVRGLLLVEATGEIDIGNAADLRTAVIDALGAGDLLIVSVTGVTYMDSSALAVLTEIARRLDTQRRRLLVVAPRESAAGKLLRIVGLEHIVPLFETIDDAAAAAGTSSED